MPDWDAVRAFVDSLLKDWEAAEDAIVGERGNSADEMRLDERITQRQVEWARLAPTHHCFECGVERTDHEGVGKYLPTCPNCGSSNEPIEDNDV